MQCNAVEFVVLQFPSQFRSSATMTHQGHDSDDSHILQNLRNLELDEDDVRPSYRPPRVPQVAGDGDDSSDGEAAGGGDDDHHRRQRLEEETRRRKEWAAELAADAAALPVVGGSTRNLAGTTSGNIQEQLKRINDREAALKDELRALEAERRALLGKLQLAATLTEADIVSACTVSQESCHAAYSFFESSPLDVQSRILDRVAAAAVPLMADPIGYQMVHRLIDRWSLQQLSEHIVEPLTKERTLFETSALSGQGVLSLQRVGETLNSLVNSAQNASPRDEATLQRVVSVQHAFYALVARSITPLSRDVNGRHLVTKALQQAITATIKLGRRYADESEPVLQVAARQVPAFVVWDSLLANCRDVGLSRHGCVVLQKALELTSQAADATGTSQSPAAAAAASPAAANPAATALVGALIDALLGHILAYVQDSFGNYLVQALLDLNRDAVTKRVVQALLHNVPPLACNKFASNVVEKCFRLATEEVRRLFVDELTDPMWLAKLAQDNYANYVLQTALVASSPEQFNQLHDALRPLFATLRHNVYGSKIEPRITKRLRELNRQQRRLTARQNKQQQQSSGQRRGGGGPMGGSGGGAEEATGNRSQRLSGTVGPQMQQQLQMKGESRPQMSNGRGGSQSGGGGPSRRQPRGQAPGSGMAAAPAAPGSLTAQQPRQVFGVTAYPSSASTQQQQLTQAGMLYYAAAAQSAPGAAIHHVTTNSAAADWFGPQQQAFAVAQHQHQQQQAFLQHQQLQQQFPGHPMISIGHPPQSAVGAVATQYSNASGK